MGLDNHLVRLYLDDLVKTLLEDKELKIVEILNKMKLSIINGDIELKDKKKEKILNNVDSLDMIYFNNFMISYNDKHSEFKKLVLEIDQVKIIEEIDKLKNNLEKVNADLNNNTNKLKLIDKEMSEINIELLKKNFEQEISDNFGQEVNITI